MAVKLVLGRKLQAGVVLLAGRVYHPFPVCTCAIQEGHDGIATRRNTELQALRKLDPLAVLS